MQALTQIQNSSIQKEQDELLFLTNRVTSQPSVQDSCNYNMETSKRGSKSSLTFLTIRSATNVKEHDVEESLLHFSVQTSRVSNTTANTVGQRFTQDLDVSFINLSSKKELIVREQFPFVGVDPDSDPDSVGYILPNQPSTSSHDYLSEQHDIYILRSLRQEEDV